MFVVGMELEKNWLTRRNRMLIEAGCIGFGMLAVCLAVTLLICNAENGPGRVRRRAKADRFKEPNVVKKVRFW